MRWSPRAGIGVAASAGRGIGVPRGDPTSRPRCSSMQQRVLPTRRGGAPCVEGHEAFSLWHARSPVHNGVSVAQGPNCGLGARASSRPIAPGKLVGGLGRAPHLHSNETVLLLRGSCCDLPIPCKCSCVFVFVPHDNFGILRVEACLWISGACSVHPPCTDISGAQGGSSNLIDASEKMWSFYKAFSTHLVDLCVCATPFGTRYSLPSDQMRHSKGEGSGCWTSQ